MKEITKVSRLIISAGVALAVIFLLYNYLAEVLAVLGFVALVILVDDILWRVLKNK